MENWTIQPNWEKLWTVIKRSKSAISCKVYQLGLPHYKRGEARLEKNKEKIATAAARFLIFYKEERRLWPALKKSKLSKKGYERLLKEEGAFRDAVAQIEAFFAETIRCCSCHQVLSRDVKFCSVSTSGKFGTCAACKASRLKEITHSSFEKKLGAILQNCRSRSKRRGQECNIDLQFLMNLYKEQKGKCYYSGEDLEFDCDIRDHNLVSVDRRDHTIGYVRGNVVLCTWFVNSVKNILSEQQFIKVCQQVAEFTKAKQEEQECHQK